MRHYHLRGEAIRRSPYSETSRRNGQAGVVRAEGQLHFLFSFPPVLENTANTMETHEKIPEFILFATAAQPKR